MGNSPFRQSVGFQVIDKALTEKGFAPFDFQVRTWQQIHEGKSGLVNAPTGCGKTYAVFLGALIQFINRYPKGFRQQQHNGLQLLWITPLRALAKDIGRAMEEMLASLDMPWRVGIRNGDTSASERLQQKKHVPEILIITPESLHLLIAQKEHARLFDALQVVAVDEWHELLGSKRGIQVELAISHLIALLHQRHRAPLIWGISATIGNLEEAAKVLLYATQQPPSIIKAHTSKQIAVHAIIPNEIDTYPWAGHLGLKMAEQVLPIIAQSNTTLLFTNTRGMSERWYQTLLQIAPHLAGTIALHHGSMEPSLRTWVEDALHTNLLKVVVCTASLDLGVDFRPVDTVIQVGSPKGIARFLQRAGRSGHAPGETSNIYFLPTHSLELMEVAALKQAIQQSFIESKEPLLLCFDVLIQYLSTLAVGDGFEAAVAFAEIKNTHAFADMSNAEFEELLLHLTEGGKVLQSYDEFKKVTLVNGKYQITNRRTAMRHRMHIGTIVSDAMMKVKMLGGGFIGVIEEWFISRLEVGDVFTLAGRNVALVMIKDMTVIVRKSASKKSIVPSWMGGRMSLTANLGQLLRQTFQQAAQSIMYAPLANMPEELVALQPLLQLQAQLSHIPQQHELLIEHLEDKDGYHLLVYPFEGRQVHEAMSALLAHRIAANHRISFSISMNDYGFELLSDQPIPVTNENVAALFSDKQLMLDIQQSINSVEMASRKFRDIAVIGGLIFQGMPGEQKKARHLQSSAGLLFRVFNEYDPNHVLVRQAYQEVMSQQMEEVRLRQALQRIAESNIIIKYPTRLTPLSFPIIADGLNRNNLSSEQLEDRVRKMQQQLMR